MVTINRLKQKVKATIKVFYFVNSESGKLINLCKNKVLLYLTANSTRLFTEPNA